MNPQVGIIERPKLGRNDRALCTHTIRNQKDQSKINSCKSKTQANCCGWTEVRYVMPDHGKWHPATDQLAGTQAYGIPFNNRNNWSIRFSHMTYDQFLFTTGDRSKWLVVNKDQLMGWYSNSLR